MLLGRLTGCLAGLVATLLLSGMGFGTDNRKPMPAQPDVVWRTIGKIVVQGGMASGCLVGPHLVLTAKHCVYDHDTGAAFRDLSFLTATNGPRGRRESARVKHVYYMAGRSAANGYTYDWALLVLDRSLGNVFGWLGCKSFDPGEKPADFPATYYGYAANPHELRPEFRECKAPFSSEGHFRYTYLPNLMRHDCASWPGSSGGAIVVWSHGKPWVAGVHVAGYKDELIPSELKPVGGFATAIKTEPDFYKQYGNVAVCMDRPIETLQDLPIPTHHRLSVENQDNEPIYVAAVFHSDNFDEEQTVGYVMVPPGQQALVVSEKEGLTSDQVYLHAHAEDGYTWSGKGTYRAPVQGTEATFVPFRLSSPKQHLVLRRKAGS